MSAPKQNQPTPESGHGSVSSYLVGFILSLIFTVIPYYLVVHKTLTGNNLVAVIIGFAVIQMFVQIFFFLHLGRGPKPFYNIVFFLATISIIAVAVGGSLLIMNNLYGNMSPAVVTTRLAQEESIAQVGGKTTGACAEVKASHIVTISNGKVSPAMTSAHLCDTLTFVNYDNKLRDIAFGPHPNHEAYGGEEEELVRKGYPKTINLNQTGEYRFHDHLEESVSGRFVVLP